MTGEQALAFGLVGAVVALLVWDRMRYDVVALLALVAGVLVGVVPVEAAFTGFADEIVIIIGSALVVSAGIARSGVVDTLVRPVAGLLTTPTRQIAFLAGAVGVLSALMKNIGALAIFLPVAAQLARRHQTSSHHVLMPMAFASLLGGLMTLIGTSPNIIVSRVREEIIGEPFAMFDYLPVGAGLMLAGWAFLLVGWRLLPKERQGARPAEESFAVEDYVSEVHLPSTSSFVGRTVADLERLSEGEAEVSGLIRERFRRYTPAKDWPLQADDVVVLRGDAPALQKIIRSAGLLPVGASKETRSADLPVHEAVVLADSPLVGLTARHAELGRRRGVNLLAVSRRGAEIARRIQHFVFKEGDLLLFQLSPRAPAEAVADAGLLPLAQRNLQIGRRRPAWLPVAIMAAAMLVLAFQLAPVAVTFLAAALAMVVSGVLKPDEAERAIEWPVLILVGALIPVSATLQSTGGTELVAQWLAQVSRSLPPVACITLIMAAAMAVTPFLNNAATVLVMAPIGASLARELGLNPDPFLMAVAVGAGSDFLTPVGHQCNTLVMAPGGYRFADYPRVGAPLSLIILTLGTWLIVTVWPL